MCPQKSDQQPPAVNSNAGEPVTPVSEASRPSRTPPASTKPPRGPRLWIMLVVLLAFGVTLWLGALVGGPVARGWHGLRHALYGHEASDTTASATHQYYTCGMHPWVILPEPGDCPICGMKLVPLDPAKFSGEVTINPVVAQDIGVRVSPVISGPVVRDLRTVGTVAYDETRTRDINIKIGGWIEKLYVDYMGQSVKKGQLLFNLYSPELYASQEEYLLAWRNRNKVSASFLPEAARGANNLVESSRMKLEYLDITPGQIEELQKRDQPAKTMTIQSPYEGVVIAKNATEGMKVEAGTRIYRIADLSKVWVMAKLYEYQLPYVELGQSATMNLSYLPGQTFKGKVIYIYPYLSDKTRQVDVRLEFDNPAGLLKPGMYATIILHSTLAKNRTLAPRSAVIDTGERKVAFVSLGDGRFEPRKVMTGVNAQDNMIEVLHGLKPGEMVVTSGQFLIDSEANVREALVKMVKGNLAVDQKATVATLGSSDMTTLPKNVSESLQNILHDYLAIQVKLAADTFDGTADPARGIAQAVNDLLKMEIPDDPHFWHKHEEVATIRGKALELAAAKSMEQARLAFADLSVALTRLLQVTGIPHEFGQEVQELRCPMYRAGQGGTIWLQTAGDVLNPYFGKSMLGCFDQRKALPVTGHAHTPPPAAPSTQGASAPAASEKSAPRTGDVSLSADQQAQINTLAQAYLKAQELMAKDQFAEVPAQFKAMHTAASALTSATTSEVATAAKQTTVASDINPQNLEEARVAYKQLSLAVIDLLKLAPPSSEVATTLYQIHCPMTKGDWLQTNDKITNPYYGLSMLSCGSIVGKINSTTQGGAAQ